jgi:hypothetical protein
MSIPIVFFPSSYLPRDEGDSVPPSQIQEMWQNSQKKLWNLDYSGYSEAYLVALGKAKHLPSKSEKIRRRENSLKS